MPRPQPTNLRIIVHTMDLAVPRTRMLSTRKTLPPQAMKLLIRFPLALRQLATDIKDKLDRMEKMRAV
jgi:hypothetical protein